MSARRCLRCGMTPAYVPPDYPCVHQLPPYLLRLLSVEGGVSDDQVRQIVPTWQPGWLLAAYDPAGGLGSLRLTANPAEAMTFGEASEALTLWRAVNSADPQRTDGKPNRPLSAFSVEPVLWAEVDV